MSDSLLVTHAQNQLNVLHHLPVVGQYLILVQFAMVREGQEVIDGLLN